MSIELFDPLTRPTAAQLNAIGDSQAALDAVYLGTAVERGAVEVVGSGSAFGFLHQHRWLLYNSTGELVDTTGANDPVALSDPAVATEVGQLDLNTVKWLTVGRYYRVTGCAWAMERQEPVSA